MAKYIDMYTYQRKILHLVRPRYYLLFCASVLIGTFKPLIKSGKEFLRVVYLDQEQFSSIFCQ